eukprot:TRINITY_DN7004_c0_g2_i2.p1 TRINITY_DN7004_c0_g2~~TRINITY_DN7004_c0_g2_i2.p1  ORF type:complete len:259 (-),score=72.18 TRINITY_DN7004_c0_g2_i2:212-922(-)
MDSVQKASETPTDTACRDGLALATSLRAKMLQPQPSPTEEDAIDEKQAGDVTTSRGDALARSLRAERTAVVGRGRQQNPKSLLEQFKKLRGQEVPQTRRFSKPLSFSEAIKEEDEEKDEEKEVRMRNAVAYRSPDIEDGKTIAEKENEKDEKKQAEPSVVGEEVAPPADEQVNKDSVTSEEGSTTDEESKGLKSGDAMDDLLRWQASENAMETTDRIDDFSWWQGWMSWLCMGRGM